MRLGGLRFSPSSLVISSLPLLRRDHHESMTRQFNVSKGSIKYCQKVGRHGHKNQWSWANTPPTASLSRI